MHSRAERMLSGGRGVIEGRQRWHTCIDYLVESLCE